LRNRAERRTLPAGDESVAFRFRPGVVPTLFACGAVVALCALGTWQVKRLHWKQALLAEWNARIDLPPAALDEVLSDPERFQYRRATASGVLEPEHSIFVEPVTRGLQEGARVLTPLRIAAPEAVGATILVDRGWIPAAELESFAARDRSSGPVEVTGLVFALAPPTTRPGSAAARRVHWLRFDPGRAAQVSELQAQLPGPLAPVLLQREDAGDGVLPLGGFERPRSRVDHRTYAVTWYSMAAIAVGVWIGFGIQQGRAQGVGSA
jgi:surfeit locus 1 family protein